MIIMSEKIVDRYLKHATTAMFQNNRTQIRCPCRKCKEKNLLNPFDGKLQEHLLMRGFMDSHTHWMIDEDDAGAPSAGNEEGGKHKDIGDEEPHTNEGDQEAEQHGVDHESQEDGDDADKQTPLTSVVRDPHVQELLMKMTTNDRGASREKSKMAQLEVDSNTPLFDGSEESRLKVALEVLEMKAKYKWSDASANACLQFWHDRLPKENKCPKNLDDAKKVVCPLDLPHEKYHVCINDCYIYRKEDNDMTTCLVCSTARYKKGRKAPRKGLSGMTITAPPLVDASTLTGPTW